MNCLYKYFYENNNNFTNKNVHNIISNNNAYNHIYKNHAYLFNVYSNYTTNPLIPNRNIFITQNQPLATKTQDIKNAEKNKIKNKSNVYYNENCSNESENSTSPDKLNMGYPWFNNSNYSNINNTGIKNVDNNNINKCHNYNKKKPFGGNNNAKADANNTIESSQKKKKKPFTEREGDWVCFKCKNLNFSFRLKCNRCLISKQDNQLLAYNNQENTTAQVNFNNDNINNLNNSLFLNGATKSSKESFLEKLFSS